MLGNISFIPNEEYFPFSKKIPRRKCLSQARRILEKIEREKKKGAKSKRGKTSSAKTSARKAPKKKKRMKV
jgi:hypothetical protein